jgi:hypothetical protein
MIVQIHAGLGNQLFRYAFGRSVSIARNEPVLFKKVGLDKPGLRAYSLDAFNINAEFTENEGAYIYEEKTSNIFDPGVYTAPPNGYFVGNWQTEKYFNEPTIRKELSFKTPMSDDTMRMAEKILAARQSAFIHVRRSGDYALPEIQAIFGGLDMAYYNKGADYIRERIEGVQFFIITDDVNWAAPRFPGLPIICHGIGDGGTGPSREYEDLWLMSLCNHAVIPSSTFGWWGAWLGDERRPRIVVTPENWYKIKKRERWDYKSDDIIPERWVKLAY